MLKVAIVGCGKIADDHAWQIGRIKDCEIVGACDREPLMARQLADRFPIKKAYCDVADLLRDARPDVVHITTPPQTHFDIAMQCLEAGSHVYVEKPFTLYANQAQKLIDFANAKSLKVTVGHDDQFSHVARRMRSLVQNGYLGGTPVHMDSYYCYELGANAYSGALLGDKRHWVRSLPGKLLQNIISHGVARIAEFMPTDSPRVIATGFISPFLRSRGESEIVDELRATIVGGTTTAYFTFSSQMRPALHQFRIYGPRSGIILDQDQETLIKLKGGHYVSYVEKFVPPVELASQYFRNMTCNLKIFARRDFQMKSGMKYLIEHFYRSIKGEALLPIPYDEILLTAKIMDLIFTQLNSQQPQPMLAPEGVSAISAIGS